MSTLHILRSAPEEQTRDLIARLETEAARQIALYEDEVDYDLVVAEVFSHDRVICWW